MLPLVEIHDEQTIADGNGSLFDFRHEMHQRRRYVVETAKLTAAPVDEPTTLDDDWF